MIQEHDVETPLLSESEMSFGPFRLEAAKQLWRGGQRIHLRRHSLAVLRYLAERPCQLVKKEELLKQLWPKIYVSPMVVRVCVREIRAALGDDAKQPQFIETLGVLGYRFIGQVVSSQYPGAHIQRPEAGHQPLKAPAEQLATYDQPLTTYFVGRERELAQLQAWYARAQQGERQMIFVSGEAGIGKTTLVERFLAQVRAGGAVRIGRGYCVEQAGQGEVYLPVLQALQQLCRAPDGNQVVAILRRHAPLWLLQLPGVIEADEREMLHLQVQGVSPHRMLREFAQAIEQVVAEAAVILCFEDLQWSDGATLEFLTYLSQLREPAQLLVIGTYRSADTVISNHPLRRVVQEMVGRGQCHELALELFTETEVEAYLRQRLAGSPVVEVLWPVIYRRTEGNALFVMHFVNYVIQHGLLAKTGSQWALRVEPATLEDLIPDQVQRLIARQIEGLSKEVQQVLAVASVVGMTFTASEVAAAANCTLETAEAIYDDLANQGQFIEVQGLAEWPHKVITVRYHFRHALYQHELYRRIGLAQQVRWHRQLGEHFATIYEERSQEIAGELAFHFERARDYPRAISYRQQAGEQALRQSAYQRALRQGQAGLALLPQLPATAERGHLELKLRQVVSIALAASRGFTDDELEDNLRRAQQLSRELEDDATLVTAVISLARMQFFRANRPAMEEMLRQEEDLAERLHDPLLLVQLHLQLMTSETFRGRHTRAEEHYQQVLVHYNPQDHRFSPAFLDGDPFVGALGVSGLRLTLSGWLDQGWSRLAQGLTLAEEFAQHVLLANGLLFAVPAKSLRGELEEAWQLAKKMSALAHEHDFSLYALLGVLLQGGLAVQCGALEEGIAALTGGLSQYRTIGTQLFTPYFLSLLAEGYRQQGKVAEALQMVSEALSLTTTNFDVFWEAELYRQKGELTLAQSSVQGPASRVQKGSRFKIQDSKSAAVNPQSAIRNLQSEAEACFLNAMEIARQQEAKLLELRATMSLARLWQQQKKKKEARPMLAEIYHWFTEGLDTKDLQEAKALLAELA
jgi:DNA-binding winged helix-turn-helix (wHTH) protein/tetratricopeptide (TPR) repeat protein